MRRPLLGHGSRSHTKGFGEPGLALTSRPPLALDKKQSDSIYKARAQAKSLELD
jgi:hypothetical protein